jgi:hypothetical protein
MVLVQSLLKWTMIRSGLWMLLNLFCSVAWKVRIVPSFISSSNYHRIVELFDSACYLYISFLFWKTKTLKPGPPTPYPFVQDNWAAQRTACYWYMFALRILWFSNCYHTIPGAALCSWLPMKRAKENTKTTDSLVMLSLHFV